jgi:alpha-N-arabinofuranosidase
MEKQSWVGRRQQHWWFRATARLDFASQSESEEAGITVFQNRNHHYEAGIVGHGENRRLIVRRTIGTLSAEVASQPIPEGPVTLVIEGVPAEYSLGYLSEDGSTVILAKGEGRYLSTEVGGAFTGVYLAMYATAHGETSDNAARFSSFEYQPLNPPEGIS